MSRNGRGRRRTRPITKASVNQRRGFDSQFQAMRRMTTPAFLVLVNPWSNLMIRGLYPRPRLSLQSRTCSLDGSSRVIQGSAVFVELVMGRRHPPLPPLPSASPHFPRLAAITLLASPQPPATDIQEF